MPSGFGYVADLRFRKGVVSIAPHTPPKRAPLLLQCRSCPQRYRLSGRCSTQEGETRCKVGRIRTVRRRLGQLQRRLLVPLILYKYFPNGGVEVCGTSHTTAYPGAQAHMNVGGNHSFAVYDTQGNVVWTTSPTPTAGGPTSACSRTQGVARWRMPTTRGTSSSGRAERPSV